MDPLLAVIAVYRAATAICYPPLKLVADTLQIGRSTATRLMNRARLGPGSRCPGPETPEGAGGRPPQPMPTIDPAVPHQGPDQRGTPSIGC